MSSSVGISLPLAIKLPEVPSSIKQTPREISISSNIPSSSTVNDELHGNCYSVTSLTELLRDSADKRCLQKTKSVHGIVVKFQFLGNPLTVLLNQMVIAYSKCSDFGSARQLFDEIPHKSVFSWTVLMVGATENGFHRDAIDYFVEMLGCDVLPDEYALSAAIQACLGVDSISLGEMVHAQVKCKKYDELSSHEKRTRTQLDFRWRSSPQVLLRRSKTSAEGSYIQNNE